MKMKRNQRQHGFTIVELLIVIVVIGILAAVTVVAYTGIQQRSKTAAYSAAVDQWEKIIRMEITESGSIPALAYSVCVGSGTANFPKDNRFNDGECYRNSYGDRFKYEPAYFSTWSTKSILPNGLLPLTKTSDTFASGAISDYETKGIYMSSNGTSEVTLLWHPQQYGSCGRGSSYFFAKKTSGDPTGDKCAIRITY